METTVMPANANMVSGPATQPSWATLHARDNTPAPITPVIIWAIAVHIVPLQEILSKIKRLNFPPKITKAQCKVPTACLFYGFKNNGGSLDAKRREELPVLLECCWDSLCESEELTSNAVSSFSASIESLIMILSFGGSRFVNSPFQISSYTTRNWSMNYLIN